MPRRFVIAFAGLLLVLVLLAAVALARGLHLGFANQLIEAQASAVLGRALRIGEAPYLRIGSVIELRAGQITLANANWAPGDDLLRLEHLEFKISTRSLFSGPLIVEDLELRGARGWLFYDEEGRSNLPEFEDSDDDQEEEPDDEALTVLLRRARIDDVRLERRIVGSHESTTIEVDELRLSEPEKNRLQLGASGTLQERPWSLALRGSGLESLISGRDVNGEFEGQLDGLNLQGHYSLPEITRPADYTIHASARGSLPPRIAALSPLLDADAPMKLELDIVDVDPGIGVKLDVDIKALDLSVSGVISRPATGDGLDLSMELDAGSLPQLAAALKLGETDNVPLDLDLSIVRDGARVLIDNLDLRAGEHRIEGRALIPGFPGTDNAEVALLATGPDFSFYQRLLKRPGRLRAPYSIKATIEDSGDGRESLDSSIDIGDIHGRVSGTLAGFPEYQGSTVEFALRAPALSELAESFALELPDTPADLQGAVRVTEDGWIAIDKFDASAWGATASVSGRLRSYPDLDGIDLNLRVNSPSLEKTSQFFDLGPLGDVPLRFEIVANGAMDDLTLRDPALDAGGLKLRAADGALRVRESTLTSDLRLQLEIEKLPELLGSYARPDMPGERFAFELLPRLSSDAFSLGLERFEGPGVGGSAQLAFARDFFSDFTLDERTHLEADLLFGDLGRVLPEIQGYRPPTRPLALHAETQVAGSNKLLVARLEVDDQQLLEAALTVPAEDGNDPLRLTLRGGGEDIHALGSLDVLPTEALPFRIDIAAALDDEQLRVDSRQLSLAGTEVGGFVTADRSLSKVTGELTVPRAELDYWLSGDDEAQNEEAAEAAQSQADSSRDRLIPDVPLPLHLLDERSIDIVLNTGPLGLRDPMFPQSSLVDTLNLRLVSGDGKARLSVDELKGSRGTLTSTIDIARSAGDGESADLRTELTVKDLLLGIIARPVNMDVLPRNDLNVSLTARGADLRALAASLNGSALLVGGAGALENTGLEFATHSFLPQLIAALLPNLNEGRNDLQIVCTVLGARARNGVVDLNPGFVFRSKRVDISARGEIDLKTERLRIRFDNQARKGLGISAASMVNPYVQITGSLAKPSLALDVTSSAIAGGAAAASGGLTVIARPLIGRFLNRGNPCKKALERWTDDSG